MDRTIGSVFWTSRRARVALALGCLYVLWGSTFLGIRVAVETMPPLLMASGRWLLAGALLGAWSIYKEGAPRLGASDWPRAVVAGALLIAAGNGAVTWAETWVPSGVAAVVVATVSLWMVLLDWLRPGGARPAGRVLLGVGVGLVGVAMLGGGGGRIDGAGLLALFGSTLGWSLGSLWMRGRPPAPAPIAAMALQMLVGGALLLGLGLLRGEVASLHVSAVTTRSLLGLVYLSLAGSLAGYTIYQWLLRATSPAVVSTYACVNPAVAVLLGWLVAGERYGARTLSTALVIIAGVALIVAPRGLRLPRPGRLMSAIGLLGRGRLALAR